jgi:hypothetical protein
MFSQAEKDRRETQRQNLVTTFNMVGSTLQQMIMNPKFLLKTLYSSILIFGAFHATKLSVALISASMMGRFGKPSLVRETSKLHANNYLTLPYHWTKK